MRDPFRAGWFPRRLRLPALLMLGFGLVPAGEAQMYVTNVGAGSGTVTSYPTSSSGNVSPSTTITDTANLKTPRAIAVNGTSIFVGTINNVGSGQITVYPLTASGTSPTVTATITDSGNGLAPWGLAVDANYIYVGNQAAGATPNSIAIYSLSACGNATPVAVIAGSNTGLSSPSGVAVDANNIYVANGGSGTITVYPLMTNGSVTNGNMSPARTITGLSGASGLAVNATSLFVINQSTPSIAVYALNASGAATPTATITGSSTTLSANATGLAVDANNIYVAQGTDNLINIFPLAATGNVAPTTIAGSNTGLNGVSAIAVLASSSSGPTTPTVTVAVGTYIYDGSPQGPQTADVSAGGSTGAITLSYAGTGLTTYAASPTPPTAAGTYTVTASVAATSSYAAASSSATPFTIAQGISTIVVSGSPAFVYTGSTQGPATIIETGSTGTQSLSYVGIGATTYGPSAMPPSAVGTYAVTASVSADANYLAATSPPFPFIIGPAALPTPTVTVNAGTYTYNGSPQGPQTSDVNAGGSTGAVTLSYAGTGSTTYAASSIPPTGAGTYTVTASVAATSSYAAGSSSATPFTIAQKSPTISFSGSSTFTYNGSPQGPSASAFTPEGSTGAITLSYAGTSSTTYAASAMPPTAVGTYTVTASVAADANYLAATSTAFSFSIGLPTPTVSVTVGTYTYNGSPQGPQTSDVSAGGSTGAITLSYAGTGSTTYAASATPPTGAGTYTVTASVAATSSYAAGSSSATPFTIAQKSPTISFSGSSTFTYSGSPQGPSASAFTPGGSTGAITLSYAGTGSTTYAASSTPPTAAGTYTVTASVAATSNYSAASSSPTAFTIAKASPSISLIGSSTFTYTTGVAQGPSASAFSTGGSTGAVTLSYAGTSSTTYAASAMPPTAVGTYTVTASVAADANYLAATSTAFSFSIGLPTPTVSVTVGTYTYNGSPQGPQTSDVSAGGSTGAITLSYAGTGSTTYPASSTPPTGAGAYTVTASVAATSSYSAGSSSPTAFVIFQATPTISVSGSSTYTYNGLPQGPQTSDVNTGGSTGAVTLSYYGPSGTQGTRPTAPGTYTATASVTADSNYEFAVATLTFMILPAPSITAVSVEGSFPSEQFCTFSGSGFSATSSVVFVSGGGATTNLIKVTDSSPNLLYATLPAAQVGQSGSFIVTTNGASSSPFPFAPAPKVTSITPNMGPVAGGTQVTVTGTGFTGATGVSIGGTALPSSSFQVGNDTTITLTTPAGTPTVLELLETLGPPTSFVLDITVTTPGGTSLMVPPDQFTYVSPPTLTSVRPAYGDSGTPVTLTGSSFTGATQVQFGGSFLPSSRFTVVNDTKITFTVMDSDLLHSSDGQGMIYDIVVFTPWGDTSALDQVNFTYTIDQAHVVSIYSPVSGSGSAPSARVATSLGPVAVSLSSDGSAGTMVGYIAGLAQGFACSFAPDAQGNFSVTTPTFGGSGGPTTLTIAGHATLASGISCTIQPLGLSYQSSFDTQYGPTSSLSGVYVASAPNGGAGTSYTMVDNHGNVFVLEAAAGSVAAGVGTVNAATAAFTVPLSSSGTATGAINPASLGVSESVTTNGVTLSFSGATTGPVPATALINLSTLGAVTPAMPLTVGFVIDGPSSKQVVLRGVGPGLSGFGVSGVLAAPVLTLYNSSGAVLGTNSGWGGTAALTSAFSSVGAFALSPSSLDAALQATLPPGAYTVVISDTAKDAGGNALAEIYDASPDLTEATQSLINVSSLGNVAPARTLTAGFSIRGNSAKTVLIRAVGPGLSPFGVANPLVDPTLAVFDSSGNLQAQNNDWGTPSAINSTQVPASAAAIASAEATCGAFALATGSKDSAVVVTLNPGNYTAVVSGAGSASGTALVEVYELP